ncbi:hypothetical protein PNIG_b0033 [Pseudoalteromonas nigrifaciens]|uniref:Uncharacterized protein n=1 Tax=Pseudoalteromonas nigrifaciens TaxID=28109 RepID=A0AAC9UKV5_9GAMM|nr:hypothetical protein PNIG_b0033 [Pseudoalteromonas nigrifaciens]GEN43709.1 hypothetical protein PNI02_31750 [Pseudoalteromonas nigrifaciens]
MLLAKDTQNSALARRWLGWRYHIPDCHTFPNGNHYSKNFYPSELMSKNEFNRPSASRSMLPPKKLSFKTQ